MDDTLRVLVNMLQRTGGQRRFAARLPSQRFVGVLPPLLSVGCYPAMTPGRNDDVDATVTA